MYQSALPKVSFADVARHPDRLLEDLYRANYGKLMRYLSYKLSNAEDAREAAQDAFIRLLRSPSNNPERYTAAMLFKIARNIAIDHLRRKRPADPIESVPEHRLSVPAAEPRERLKVPDDLLTPRQKLVMTLLYDREMEVADAAAFLGVDAQTIRSTHHKAILRLRAPFAGDSEGKPLVSQNEA